jgi:hypothetical protein
MRVEVRTVRPLNAATAVDIPLTLEETGRSSAPPASEQARYEPRFRVVTRKPLRTPRKSASTAPLHRTLLFAAVPALCLLVYVLFWTMAIRGGFYRDQLQTQIQALREERQYLEAGKRAAQASGPILERARVLGMRPPDRKLFFQLPAEKGAVKGSIVR